MGSSSSHRPATYPARTVGTKKENAEQDNSQTEEICSTNNDSNDQEQQGEEESCSKTKKRLEYYTDKVNPLVNSQTTDEISKHKAKQHKYHSAGISDDSSITQQVLENSVISDRGGTISADLSDDLLNGKVKPRELDDKSPKEQESSSNIDQLVIMDNRPETTSDIGDVTGSKLHYQPSSRQSHELSKMLKDAPHLQEEFKNIDQLVKELKDDPLLTKGLYCDPDALAYFDFRKESEKDRRLLGDYFSKTEGAALFETLYRNLLHSLAVPNMASLTSEITDKNTERVQKLSRLRMIIWCNTTFSFAFVEEVCNSGVLGYFVDDLKILKVSDINTERMDLKYILESAIYILYNCSRNPSTKDVLRSYDTVSNLLPFLKSHSKVVKLQTLFALANLVTEQENKLLLADNTIFDVLFEILKTAWQQHTHDYVGWTVEELLAGMTGLAKNDANKIVLSEKAVVPILIEVMRDGSEKEQELAVKCIWELSFDTGNKQAFMKNADLMNLLKLLKVPSEKAKAAEGALWTIEEIQKQHDTDDKKAVFDTSEKKPPVVDSDETPKVNVMISYHWADQHIVLKIRESLESRGYKVWLDTKTTSEATLEAMAEAIESADVVLICMSDNYKTSSTCRTEAEYTFSLRKPYIPLLMQKGYRPEGWLGIMAGRLVALDFSSDTIYERGMDRLLSSLETEGRKKFS